MFVEVEGAKKKLIILSADYFCGIARRRPYTA
jgi:hypothetical protein